MKKLIIALLLLSSCASTEKLLTKHTPSKVAKIEAKRFNNKQLPAPREYALYSIVAFVAMGLILEE